MANVKKKCKVVMLPTEKASIAIRTDFEGDNKLYYISSGFKENSKYKPQYLYIISDEEIKEGDWRMMIDKSSQFYGQFEKHLGKHDCNNQWAKIIATTDSSLKINKFELGVFKDLEYSLPQPSPQFIEKYVEAYNNGNPIEDVMVEYENSGNWVIKRSSGYLGNECTTCHRWLYEHQSLECFCGDKIKVDKNNYITITKCKESWSKEEVVDIIKKYNNQREDGLSLSKWVEENL